VTELIPPDYQDDDIDEILDFDEGKEEEALDKSISMTPPLQQQTGLPFSTPRWGEDQQKITTPPWQNVRTGTGTNIWGQPQSNNPWRSNSWGTGGSTYNSTNREQLIRGKKVIFIDFLDCIVETFNSGGIPGYLPRDIYDLTPKFNVWQKLAALNPEKVYILIPRNLLPTTNGAQGWEATLTYYCCSLSSFLRIPYTGCQVLVQSVIGQPKEDIMLSVINDSRKPINKKDILSIGIYSGVNGQSNIDKFASEVCGVDYVDLFNLLQMI